MKNQLFIVSFVFLLFQSGQLLAETGCLVPGYPELLIFQTINGGTYSNEPSLQPATGCWWVLVKASSGCIGHAKTGTKGEYELQCPIDGYTPLLAIFTIGLTFLKLLNPRSYAPT